VCSVMVRVEARISVLDTMCYIQCALSWCASRLDTVCSDMVRVEARNSVLDTMCEIQCALSWCASTLHTVCSVMVCVCQGVVKVRLR